MALRVAALLALATPVSALASYDGDFYVITPSSTGMLGSYVYSVVHDDVAGQTWVAADDPFWDEGGIASTFDGLTWDSYSNVNEEVPTHLVQELHVGPDGMVWGASELGLLRFDGDTVEIAWSMANAGVWPTSNVQDFEWDSAGNLWVALGDSFATAGGVAKYDGATWTLYNGANGSYPWTRPADGVETLEIDSLDNVWVSNSAKGFLMYDGATWQSFQAPVGTLTGTIHRIEVEDNGTAWFGTLGGGVTRWDGVNWETWDLNRGPLGTNDIADIAIDNVGDVWISTYIGSAFEYTGVGTDWVRTNLPLSHVYSIDFDADNRLIAGGIGGLVWGDGQLLNHYNVNLSNRWLDDIYAASDGMMWFAGGEGGVTRFDGTTWMSHNPYNAGLYDWPFAADLATRIVEGLDGHIFVNPANHGVGEWDGTQWIEHIGIQSIEVMDVAPDGTLWAGPYNGAELVTYDGAAWRQVNVPYNGWSGDMYDLAVDPLGDVWLGTVIGVFHSSDGGATWTNYLSTNSGLPENNVFDLQPEPDGSGIWMATHGGLAFFDGATWTVYTMANSGLPADSTDRLAIAPDGALWVGAFDGVNWPYDGGIARFDGTTWRTWTEENSNIPHEEIWSLGIDASGNVWVGTASEGVGLLYAEGDGGATTFVEIPRAWTANKGTWLTGQLIDLEMHDDAAVWIDTVPSGTKMTVAAATIDFQTHVQSPGQMTVHSEFITDGVIGVSLAIKNVATGAWDPIGTEARFQFGDGTITADVPNAADHVAADGLVQVRVIGRARNSKNPFGVALGIDQVELTVVE